MPSIAIQVPYQAQPGMKIKAKMADGRSFLITVPEGAYYPTQLMVSVPDPPVVTTGAPMAPPGPAQELPSDSKIEKMEKTGTTMAEGVDQADLYSCCGICCIMCNLYMKFPACLGMHFKGDVLCMELEALVCKVGVQPGSWCMCCKNEIECLKPTTIIKMTAQCFCIDQRCAFPCDNEVPCVLTLIGCTICRDFTCICKGFEKLEGDEENEAPANGGAPVETLADDSVAAEQMDR